jgi:hypothetical protein
MTARDELVEAIKNVRHTESYATDEDYADAALAWALSRVGEDNDETPVGHSYSWNIGYNQRGEEIRGRFKGEKT